MINYEEIRSSQEKESGKSDLKHTHKKNGYYDGKIFYDTDRATYTFIFEEEVIVLHFDLNKKSLYFKGRLISSLEIHPELSSFLSDFKRHLQENSKTASFLKIYDQIVSSLCEIS